MFSQLQLPEAPNGDESKKQNYAMRSARTLSDSELRRHPEQQWGSKMEILSVRPCAESEYSHRAALFLHPHHRRGQIMSVPLDLLEKTSISNPELLWITQCACVASLTLVLWEMLINLGDESSLIWPRSHGSYLTIMVKWAYLFSRYFAIAVQIANINVIFTFARAAPVAADTCKSFYIYQGCSVEALLLAFDFALLARVHALYGQKKRYTIIGLAAILVELMTMFISGFSAIPNVPYNQDCLVMSTPTSVVYFVLGVGFSQCVILGMTYYKKIELERGSGGGRIPVLWIVVRDGALAFTVMASQSFDFALTVRDCV
ncbi:hypothetical protein SERLADRAFT_440611 [Serpula lacrymans var. lacrymans S7.9]|uniref:DUF6533 domain-containing protein n=1 Tax=Serpula lacrymans var. lacrymans (strain S7.9) TaxID=578457 RepID=F8P366_SERL9|nr:uncharacterized protein SERLADRAFT_440611 [Serpula lacrymans var. lacrymans S7.9]EGO22597.1 hypothetical protein SERLADRAFT_440611 [Serpula lacrymans var. lacrymans S7.9]